MVAPCGPSMLPRTRLMVRCSRRSWSRWGAASVTPSANRRQARARKRYTPSTPFVFHTCGGPSCLISANDLFESSNGCWTLAGILWLQAVNPHGMSSSSNSHIASLQQHHMSSPGFKT